MRLPARLAFVAALLLAAVVQAAEPNPAEVARLRAGGQATLDALIARTGGVGHRPQNPTDAALIDAVAAQKDAWASGLFWHTDLAAAQRQAVAENKPILSLRLLGRLDSELSCANSRFFRVALYPDPQVQKLLRENFVLHWQSERPVPVVTVDFGDGRTLTRTLTGNSIHYVLMPDGTPIDAIPGLYVPSVFAETLDESSRLFQRITETPSWRRGELLREAHRGAAQFVASRLTPESRSSWFDSGVARAVPLAPAAPPAMEAAVLTRSKVVIERPMLQALAPKGQLVSARTNAPDDAVWRRLASNYFRTSVLSDPAIALFRSKLPPTIGKNTAKTAEVLAKFNESMALDTAINEYSLRQMIRSYFVTGQSGDLESLNKLVYAEVFLTPASDPWLGLGDETTFTGIDPSVASADAGH